MYHDVLIFLAEYLILIMGIFLILIVLVDRKKFKLNWLKEGLVIFLTYVFTLLISKIIYIQRPIEAQNFISLFGKLSNNGFPSMHTLIAGMMAAIIYSLDKKIGLIYIVGACLIGLSRVLLKVHHWQDVLASLIIVIVVYSLVYARKNKKKIV